MYFRHIETDTKKLAEHVEAQKAIASRRLATVASKKKAKKANSSR